MFGHITLPDESLDEHVSVLGHITLSLTDIQVSGFSIGSGAFAVDAPNEVALGLGDINLSVSLNYKWRRVHWPHASDHGSVTASTSDSAMAVGVALTAASGKLTAAAAAHSADFNNFKIKFHGSHVAWLYNLLMDLFKGKLKSSLQDAVSKELEKMINTNLNAALAKLPTQSHIGGGKSESNINTGFAAATAGTSSYGQYFSLLNEFAVSNAATGAACPLQNPVLPGLTPKVDHNMIEFMMADSFPNCLMQTLYENKFLTMTLTNKDVPKGFPLQLNTTYWAQYLPQLAEKYPGQLMQLDVSSQFSPYLNTSQELGAVAHLGIRINSSVVQSDGSLVHTHVMGVFGTLGLDLTITDGNNHTNITIHPRISKFTVNVTIEQSSIGPIDDSKLEGLVAMIGPILQQFANQLLSNGIPLPFSPLMYLVNPTITYQQGYFTVATDFDSKLPRSFMEQMPAPAPMPAPVVEPSVIKFN
eukprot:TRINITY_DN65873_c4_g2_i2.p2 TRINITY_DN65873_c4_g2~~TRINITY_DN65873_c4_g2_i2.p2  ORF type:complete len:473 (+),score=285.79 TRINITY_DN65873_c4_g2_i2:307-1725(+)